MIDGLQLSKHIPIGNSDAGSFFSNSVLTDVEYGVCIHHSCMHTSYMRWLMITDRCRTCTPGSPIRQQKVQRLGFSSSSMRTMSSLLLYYRTNPRCTLRRPVGLRFVIGLQHIVLLSLTKLNLEILGRRKCQQRWFRCLRT